MSIAKINSAFVASYQFVGLNLPTGYENDHFTPPVNAPYANVFNAVTSLKSVTLGSSGEDEALGIFSATISVPKNTGNKLLNDSAWRLAQAFQGGTTVWYQGVWARIKYIDTSAIRDNTAGGVSITVSIYWRSRFARDGAVAMPPPGGDTTTGYGDLPDLVVLFNNALE